MTTRLVEGTSRPIEPADVERSTRDRLKLNNILNFSSSVLPILVIFHHLLLVISCTVSSKLLVMSNCSTSSQLMKFHLRNVGPKCVQVQVFGSGLEEITCSGINTLIWCNICLQTHWVALILCEWLTGCVEQGLLPKEQLGTLQWLVSNYRDEERPEWVAVSVLQRFILPHLNFTCLNVV